jgi:glutaminyl-tRNA synthetase
MSDKEEKGTDPKPKASNFIRDIIDADLAAGRCKIVATRFPPEPNAYLHIGHAKSIHLNFGIARDYGGTCNLRFDDTNPMTEEQQYIDAIKEDVRWLGFDWGEREFHASDNFDQLYEWAEKLIGQGDAYVDDLSEEEIREQRGDFHKKGVEGQNRNRRPEENLDLFHRMRAGEFADGAMVLRAKIDMNSPNMNMRDPIMYRIKHAAHPRTGDKWCIYPMYDYAHGQSDAIEGITHSICTLEFEDHRPLYDWYIEKIGIENRPRQYEFARLNLTYMILSKRRLLELIKEKHLTEWDDPRMPSLAGFRRRGYTPEAIRDFCVRVGVAKADSIVDVALLEHCIRDHLNPTAPRVMAVLDPLKVVIENYPEGQSENIDAPYMPEDFSGGSRNLPFGRELFIERDDFREDAPKKWHRLSPGAEVRLRYACLLKCVDVVKDESGEVVELRCTWDPESRGGKSPDGRKVRGTLHWVSAEHAVDAEVRLYDRLFTVPNPMDVKEGESFMDHINPDSLTIMRGCKLEPSLAEAAPGRHFQFERLGYFFVDPKTSKPGAPVFNRTVTLKDAWARIERTQQREAAIKAKEEKKKSAAKENFASFNDFAKLDLRVGSVVESVLVDGADKLIKVMVDIGEARPRQIFAGIRSSYPDPGVLVGKQVIVVANLAPRKMKFGVSEGMILSGGDEHPFVTTFDGALKPGEKVK